MILGVPQISVDNFGGTTNFRWKVLGYHEFPLESFGVPRISVGKFCGYTIFPLKERVTFFRWNSSFGLKIAKNRMI